MIILLTGVAGFIGFHAAKRCLAEGHTVIGIDNINSYYDPRLKHARLIQLRDHPNFSFHKIDLADQNGLDVLADQPITHILHLAAQAGVRYSLVDPHAYIASNVSGHLNILEFARHSKTVEHVAYASSSSIYGEREAGEGFQETDIVRQPASLYAATKLSGELMSESYARLYGIPQTGLRFFTVYGPWGRPDMAYWIFTEKILTNETITLFAPDIMLRDFTYVDDITAVLPKILDTPPDNHAVYNLGRSSPNKLTDLVSAVETACGRSAKIDIKPQQAGDVRETFANVEAAKQAFGFAPKVNLEDGIRHFVDWYKIWTR